MQEGVFQDGVTDPDLKPVRKNALLGPATSEDERPILKPTPPVQTSDLPDDKVPDMWVEDTTLPEGGFWDTGPSFEQVESVWNAVDEEVTQVLADAFGSVMGWWDSELPGDTGSTLKAKKPTWLIGNAERFETFYLESPWLTRQRQVLADA